jgi:hypothetical protein
MINETILYVGETHYMYALPHQQRIIDYVNKNKDYKKKMDIEIKKRLRPSGDLSQENDEKLSN